MDFQNIYPKTADLRNHPDGISVEHGGRFYFMGIWNYPRDGQFGTLFRIAIDARTEAANFFDKLGGIRGDSRLSDAAKASDSKDAARKILTALGDAQRKLNKVESGIDADRLKLAEVPKADAAETVIDVALAAHFRTLKGAEREATISDLASGSQQRMVDAVLRLPGALFGITPQVRDVIEANAIARRSPDETSGLKRLSEALRTAQGVISKCVRIVNENAMLTLEERMTSLGADAWQAHVKDGAPDALGALARKYNVQ